jgi:hypothetical protein
MLAEWSVELGADDPRLEIPWSSEDGRLRFFDLMPGPAVRSMQKKKYLARRANSVRMSICC